MRATLITHLFPFVHIYCLKEIGLLRDGLQGMTVTVVDSLAIAQEVLRVGPGQRILISTVENMLTVLSL